MRKEPFGAGDFVHVFNRGNRKMNIVRDENDRWRFLTCLRFYNDKTPAQYLIRSYFMFLKSDNNLVRSNLTRSGIFEWPDNENEQRPIVSIIAYYLADNHYHLLLREIIPGGITEFMRKLGGGFTMYNNDKYGESGKVFQGSYHARTINTSEYLQYVDAYIQVLNALERLDNPLTAQNKPNLDMVIDNPFSGLGETLGYRNFEILDREIAQSEFSLPKTKEEYEKLMESVMAKGGFKKVLGKIAIEKRQEGEHRMIW